MGLSTTGIAWPRSGFMPMMGSEWNLHNTPPSSLKVRSSVPPTPSASKPQGQSRENGWNHDGTLQSPLLVRRYSGCPRPILIGQNHRSSFGQWRRHQPCCSCLWYLRAISRYRTEQLCWTGSDRAYARLIGYLRRQNALRGSGLEIARKIKEDLCYVSTDYEAELNSNPFFI